jgi:hypothetical protein
MKGDVDEQVHVIQDEGVKLRRAGV